MNRRNFLKILSAAPAIAAVPVLAKTNSPSGLSDTASIIDKDGYLYLLGDTTTEVYTPQFQASGNNLSSDTAAKFAKELMEGFEKSRIKG